MNNSHLDDELEQTIKDQAQQIQSLTKQVEELQTKLSESQAHDAALVKELTKCRDWFTENQMSATVISIERAISNSNTAQLLKVMEVKDAVVESTRKFLSTFELMDEASEMRNALDNLRSIQDEMNGGKDEK